MRAAAGSAFMHRSGRFLHSPTRVTSQRPRRARVAGRRSFSKRLFSSACLTALLLLVAWALVRGGHPTRPQRPTSPPATTTAASAQRHSPTASVQLGVVRSTRMAAPLQDAAAARIGDASVLLAGGLTAADTSSDAVSIVGPDSERPLGRLPSALHDAAAVQIGRATYLFGGGNGTSQLDQVLRIDMTGRVTVAGRLPAPSSDQVAAVVGGTAYVVGGFTGSRWLDTIVAWRPGRPGRVVARLPTPIRYAAATAAAGRLVIAGGSLPTGTASRAVLVFDPRSDRVHRIATLPVPITHAAAAAIERTVFVIGGRRSALGTPTSRIVAVDMPSGRVRAGGVLRAPLSDLAAVTLGRRVLVAGGRGEHGTVASLTELAPRAAPTAAAPTDVRARGAVDVYAADRADHLTGAARYARPLVYVPNSQSNSVDVIDPRTFRIVEHFDVGVLPQHVVPSWDCARCT